MVIIIKVGIVGSRSRNSYKDLNILLNAFWRLLNILRAPNSNKVEIQIISGGARSGADKFANDLSKRHRIPIKVYRPDYKKYGKGAPIIRNTLIANESDYLIALWDKKSKGTKDTIDKFLSINKKNKENNNNLILLTEDEKENYKVLSYMEDEYDF